MKKLFSTVIMAVFLSVCSYAQTEIHSFNEEGKVVFEGVALGTPIDEFKKNLEEKGYKLFSEVLSTCIYIKESDQGTYRLIVSYTPKTKLVSHMTMNTGVKQEWEQIIKAYNDYSSKLISALGNPLVQEEKAPKENTNDLKTIAEGVEKGNIIYNKVWRTNAGMIVIEINNTVVGMRINVLPSILYSDIETYRLYIKEKAEQ